MANACIDEKSKGEMDEFGEHSPNSTEQLLEAVDFVVPERVVRLGLPSRCVGSRRL
jgi:hypothetical protein